MDHEQLVQMKTEAINSLLKNIKTIDVVEILANVLIHSGMSKIDTPEQNITVENIIDIVMNDRSKNGETLHNALAHQGLVMLMWLRNK